MSCLQQPLTYSAMAVLRKEDKAFVSEDRVSWGKWEIQWLSERGIIANRKAQGKDLKVEETARPKVSGE